MKTKIVQGERKCKLVCNLPSRRLFKALPKIVQAGRNPKFFCGLLAVVRRGPQGFLYFLRPKSTEDPAALAAVRFFAAEKHMRLPQQEAVSGNPFPQISRYFPLWNQICGFWFGGPGKNRYL